jgi:ABC-2 type transport system permease protein
VARAALLALRRDRAALALTFLVPVVFFSIFAAIFGGASARAATRRVRLLAVDEDGSPRSRRLLDALAAEPALDLRRAPARANGEAGAPAPYDRAAAEAAVRAGEAPLALVVPGGFGAARLAFGRAPAGAPRPRVELLADRSDPIAPQLVAGLLQKVVFTRLPELTIAGGVDALDPVAQFTPEQRARMAELAAAAGAASERAAPGGGAGDAPIEIATRDLLGETKKNPMVAFYAAGLGVMFLMFTAAGAGGALIEERESGTLERILSTEVTMTSLLAGKLLHLTALGVVQLALMFAWGAAVFGLDLRGRIAGSLLLALPTALASSSFGLVLAALAKSRKQLVALSNLLVLSLAAIGGSMFPRFLMPESVQRLGLVAWNAWALEGFLDVLWRDAPLAALVPEISVLLLWSALFFLLARRLSRSWEVV